MSNESLLAGVAAGLAVTGLCSIPAVSGLVAQLRKREPKQESYGDGDGTSTPEAVKAYSAKLPKALILVFSTVGTAVSIALAVLSTLHASEDDLFLENWLSVAAWVR